MKTAMGHLVVLSILMLIAVGCQSESNTALSLSANLDYPTLY